MNRQKDLDVKWQQLKQIVVMSWHQEIQRVGFVNAKKDF